MSRYVTFGGWDSAPHLTEQAKREILATYPPHLHDAIQRGWPVLGSGVIYPIAESEIRVEDFPIPEDAPKAFGMDAGPVARWTAATWFFQHPQSKVYYLYDCYKVGQQEVSIHAEAIKARGAWIPGVIDPAANGTIKDGVQVIKLYRDHGIQLSMAKNAINAGILKVWQMMAAGCLKVFASCAAFFEEFRNYHRDANGNIVKKNDHLLDCLRYFVLSGMNLMNLPGLVKQEANEEQEYSLPAGAWMI